ncbi:hypothetical protein ACFXAE_05905 [Streptomyces sp. NPDC059454]|uniref:hypothetical protein n=1 Tax=Streptomyces sp. NPDC059454 TaxID=3346836 RepID=UPI003692D614
MNGDRLLRGRDGSLAVAFAARPTEQERAGARSRVRPTRVAEPAASSGSGSARFEMRSGTVGRMRQLAAVHKPVAAAERLVAPPHEAGFAHGMAQSAKRRHGPSSTGSGPAER